MSTTIFPGMDPYLEHPSVWTGLHSRFVVYLADQLQSKLGDRYVTAVEQRVYLEGADRLIEPDVHLTDAQRGAFPTWHPAASQASGSGVQPVLITADEVEVSESYVVVMDLEANERVVTVLELLSPSNKLPGAGRESYRQKQHELLHSDSNLVEIDLLRAGMHTVAAPSHKVAAHQHDYLVSVNRAEARRVFELYFIQLRDRLPEVRVPLSSGDSDAMLDLQSVLTQTYDNGHYRTRLRYQQPCVPPLREESQLWANQQIAAARVE